MREPFLPPPVSSGIGSGGGLRWWYRHLHPHPAVREPKGPATTSAGCLSGEPLVLLALFSFLFRASDLRIWRVNTRIPRL